MNSKNICFLVFPGIHLLDLSGSVQAFYEATMLGNINYNIRYVSNNDTQVSQQGLTVSSLLKPESVDLKEDDFIVIPGTDATSFMEGRINTDVDEVRDWIIQQYQKGVNIASICSGALVLARTGLLDNKKCTTHWKCIDFLSDNFPEINVQTDCLFVSDGRIHSSAGMTSGIDMSLSIIEEHQGPIVSSKVAREMVVYLRRYGSSDQHSMYLDYHTHFNPLVHKAQNYIISHPSENPTLEVLAEIANTSNRNLTRAFKQATGHTVSEFKHNIKLDLARHLINNPNLTVEQISEMCGFKASRQLQRLWKEKFGVSISKYRNS